MNRVVFSSLVQEWRTPRAVFDELNKEFAFNCDPCPTQSLIDGLEADWGGRTFVNPPFKGIEGSERLVAEALEGVLEGGMKRYRCSGCMAGVHCDGISNNAECECEECGGDSDIETQIAKKSSR